jgi:RNA polymerase-binding transcription factor DksA
MTSTDTAQLRAELEAERADLQRRLGELTIDGTSDQDFDENFADTAQVAAEQGENLSLSASLKGQLDDVEGALARIDAGTYGLCEVCSQPVAPARLEAMPATPFCIEHA